jgi:spore germination protein
MQIHVVRPGDSVYKIARGWGVSPEAITRINELQGQPYLVVGQALLIPVADNRPRTRAEINAYVEPGARGYSPASLADVQRALPQLTYLAPFSYRVLRNGSLQAPPLDGLLAQAQAAGVTPMMVVSNLEEGGFSGELGSIILNDQEVQNRLLDNIIATARQQGFRDIHFDFEFLRPQDREAYNQFLRRAAERIHNEGWLISTALAPKIRAGQVGQWYEAHDYRAHGQIVDFVVIMTYEWGYSGGPPMAVSPLPNVRQVLEYALTEIPAGKIMMGQNLYGYDWTLPYVRGGPFARSLSPQAAIRLAAERGVPIQYDWEAQAPFFTYYDDQRRQHVVWFEDARSIAAKIALVKELRLRGISYWKLGLPFPQNWELLRDRFNIVKR